MNTRVEKGGEMWLVWRKRLGQFSAEERRGRGSGRSVRRERVYPVRSWKARGQSMESCEADIDGEIIALLTLNSYFR